MFSGKKEKGKLRMEREKTQLLFFPRFLLELVGLNVPLSPVVALGLMTWSVVCTSTCPSYSIPFAVGHSD